MSQHGHSPGGGARSRAPGGTCAAMAAVIRRIHFAPRPFVIISAVLAVVAITAPLTAILGDEPSLRAAGIGAVAGVASLAFADRRREGGDVIRLLGATGGMLAVPAALMALAPDLSAEIDRLAGPDRVATAVAVSGHLYDDADAVVVTTPTSSADAVAAAPLASEVRGPLLFLGDGLDDEIQRLGATRAYVVGAAAHEPALERDLRDAGITEVVRITGVDRHATSAAVANRLRPDRVFVTSAWADAITVTPLAAEDGAIMTTRADALPAATVRALQRVAPREVVVVGGEAAVADTVLSQIEGLLPDAEVTRLAGSDRWATSLEALERSGHSGERVWIASGTSWPDAVVAATGAAAEGRPLLLVPSDGASPSADTVRWLRQHRTELRSVTVVGGEQAVAERLVERVRR